MQWNIQDDSGAVRGLLWVSCHKGGAARPRASPGEPRTKDYRTITGRLQDDQAAGVKSEKHLRNDERSDGPGMKIGRRGRRPDRVREPDRGQGVGKVGIDLGRGGGVRLFRRTTVARRGCEVP